MNKEKILNSIFYPRKSFLKADEKDVIIPVEKNVEIGVRLFLFDKNLPVILYFHGNAELCQEYDSIANIYNQNNINFIVADYRGYGLSSGVPSKDNLHSDAIKVFDYILSYLRESAYKGELVVMGRSLGSASVCEIIANRERYVSKCIIESGFGTEYPLLDLMRVNPESINYSLSDGFQNLLKLKKYKKPVFFIHADMDHIIPLSEAELMLKESKSQDKSLFIVKGANHNNIIAISGDLYFEKISSFISS